MLTCTAVFLLSSGCGQPRPGDSDVPPGVTAEPIGEFFAAAPDAGHDGGGGSEGASLNGIGNLSPDTISADQPDASSAEDADVQEVAPVVRRMDIQAIALKKEAAGLGAAVKVRRFDRLDDWAKKQGWVVSQMPVEALRDPQIRGWWEEWRKLRPNMDEMRAKQ